MHAVQSPITPSAARLGQCVGCLEGHVHRILPSTRSLEDARTMLMRSCHAKCMGMSSTVFRTFPQQQAWATKPGMVKVSYVFAIEASFSSLSFKYPVCDILERLFRRRRTTRC